MAAAIPSTTDAALKHSKNCAAHCQLRVMHNNWRKVIKPVAGWLRSTRMCESGGNYHINTGNGYYGAYQFDYATWLSVGGKGYAHQAGPLQQDYRAAKLYRRSGSAPWPVCG